VRMRPRPSHKTVAYFELREALRETGCVVCSLLVKRSLTVLQSLLYEQVTDPDTREQLRRSQGLCNWHAWLLVERSTGQASIAMIYERLLLHRIEALRAWRIPQRHRTLWQRLTRSTLPVTRPRKAPCPVCGLLTETDESGYLKTLLDALPEEAFAREFRQSFGLCLPHLEQAMTDYHTHANLPQLLDLELHKLEALREELRLFIRKSDYRFATEAIGPEGSAWKRVLELFVGKSAVFGNERLRRRDQ
jgi:hypothetical protein